MVSAPALNRLAAGAGALSLAVLAAGPFVGAAPAQTARAAASCETLATLALPATTITSVQAVGAGAFKPPVRYGVVEGGSPAQLRLYATLPAFCRVSATLTPSPDSDIKAEVWMPAAGWNGKFLGVGNGGWGGAISYTALANAVAAGYASASNDTGHEGNTAAFVIGHPERLVDLGYRAMHEMTVQAKAIVNAHYGGGLTRSIFNGCSLGGRQGIAEAMRYPEDYNGIIAGDAAINGMRLNAARVAISAVVHRSDDSYIPPEKYAAVHTAVLDACDAKDGVRDGVLEDPSRCPFDFASVQCAAGDGPACLTASQVETAKAMYAPLTHPKTGATVFPALLVPGTELGWGVLAGPAAAEVALQAFQYFVFKNPAWNASRFNAATDIDLALAADGGTLELADPNLKPYFDRGGRLLMYHGLSDPQTPAANSIGYFSDVVKTVGTAAAGRNIQLYLVPGMYHCAGGPGTDTFDKVAVLEAWLDSGAAPDRIVAAHRTNGTIDRTRPLCPYGQVARWKGAGSIDEAANFLCVAN